MANTTTYGKTALIADVTANTTGITQKQVSLILDTALDTIQTKVQHGEKVTIPGFGTWQPTQRAARSGVNLHTKQKIRIPASRSVRFTPGSTFKAAMRGGYSAARQRAGLGTKR
jgi:DNA-binding protein HU-beta